ncbi:MAG: protease HtpX [Halieaceae bacterium]|nr:protease HtpX [Halieaceae bacterium]|tara:strand:- start:1229 stop:2110 length:882 start_codon:yes stop_codon:yes gene_type:complete
MRILLFLATNIAVMVLVSLVFNLLDLEGILSTNGVDLNLNSLLIFCALFGFLGSFVSLLASKYMAKRGTRARIIETPRNHEEQWLLDTVKSLSQEAGIGMPEVGVFPSDAANAFATGWNRNNALVAVSTGLMRRFEEGELRAVLAHEIGHVANGDMITLTLIQGVVNTFVMFFARIIGHTVDRVVFKTERGYGIGYYVVTVVAQVVLGILASTVVMWFSRHREFRADASGAQLAGSASMIAALQRLKAEQGLPDDLPGELTAFGIRSGGGTGLDAPFRSHPPLDDRIRALSNP